MRQVTVKTEKIKNQSNKLKTQKGEKKLQSKTGNASIIIFKHKSTTRLNKESQNDNKKHHNYMEGTSKCIEIHF